MLNFNLYVTLPPLSKHRNLKNQLQVKKFLTEKYGEEIKIKKKMFSFGKCHKASGCEKVQHTCHVL